MDRTRTFTPRQSVAPAPNKKLKPAKYTATALSLQEGLDTTRAQRDALNQTLDYWNDMVEMNVAPRNEPWPNAKSMCVPIVAMMMEAVESRIVSAVFVPRLYVLSATDAQGQAFVHNVENWYNTEFRRKKRLRAHLDCVNLALRDGVSFMEILWEHREVIRKVVTTEPTGELDENGKPIHRKVVMEAKIVEAHGVSHEPVELRDLYVVPAMASDLQTAPSVYRRMYLSEGEMRELCNPGPNGEEPTFDLDQVERVIAFHTTGVSDQPSEVEGTATFEQGGVLSAGDMGSNDPDYEANDGEGIKSKGLFEVFRVHTREYDFDEDGIPEENVLWYYDRLPTLLGPPRPFEYWHQKRPFAKCAPMPRPQRLQGWSVPERLRGFQEEANARSNQRGDAMDLKISPPLYELSGAKPVNKDKPWGPGARWEIPSKDAVGIIDVGTIDPASWQDEALTYRYAAAMVGIESPTMPIAGNQKVPMKQQQAQMTASNVRLDRMALEVRLFCEEVLEQTHRLNIQYGEDEDGNDLGGKGFEGVKADPQTGEKTKFKISMEALTQDYILGVAGAEGALDQDSDRSLSMTLYALLLQNPLVQGNLERVHAVTSYVLDKFNLPEYTRFIGDVEAAKQQQQQQQQAAQKAHEEEMQMQILSHSKSTLGGGSKAPAPGASPAPPASAPGGGQGAPQPGAPPGPPPMG